MGGITSCSGRCRKGICRMRVDFGKIGLVLHDF